MPSSPRCHPQSGSLSLDVGTGGLHLVPDLRGTTQTRGGVGGGGKWNIYRISIYSIHTYTSIYIYSIHTYISIKNTVYTYILNLLLG